MRVEGGGAGHSRERGRGNARDKSTEAVTDTVVGVNWVVVDGSTPMV